MNDRLARCFCIDLFHAFITFLIPSLICCATLQVAALQFGDFYNMQYVKMYTIFMMQLQVKNQRKYFFLCNKFICLKISCIEVLSLVHIGYSSS
jgi:hypothetical protein